MSDSYFASSMINENLLTMIVAGQLRHIFPKSVIRVFTWVTDLGQFDSDTVVVDDVQVLNVYDNRVSFLGWYEEKRLDLLASDPDFLVKLEKEVSKCRGNLPI